MAARMLGYASDGSGRPDPLGSWRERRRRGPSPGRAEVLEKLEEARARSEERAQGVGGAAGPTGDREVHGLFDKLDANSDGVITREEFRRFYASDAAEAPTHARHQLVADTLTHPPYT